MMTQCGRKRVAGMLGALALGIYPPGLWAAQGAEQVPGAGMASNPADHLEREISVRGKVVCLGCKLEDVQQQHPEAHSLYQVTYQQGQVVMQIDEVDDLRRWQRDTMSNTLHIRAADDVLAQLTDEQTMQKE